MNKQTRGVRRKVVVALITCASVLLVASISWACTVRVGSTFFGDGTSSKSVVRGARITAFALGASPGVNYQLVMGTSTGGHAGHACMDVAFIVNPNFRKSTLDGYVPNTSGPAGNSLTPKTTYQVCFRDMDFGNEATGAATLTII